MSLLPTSITPSVTSGHDDHHEVIHGWINNAELGKVYNVQHFGAVGDGVANDTAAIAAAITACPAGGIVYFPFGVYKTDSIVITKMLHLLGDGRFSSWLKPNSAATTGLVQFSVPGPSTTTRGVYGPTAKGLGWDLSAHATSRGLYVGATTGWFVGEDLFFQGGDVHVHNIGTNSRYERLRMVDAAIFFKVNGDTGMELTLKDVDATRVGAGTTTWGIECISTLTTGNGGDMRLDNVVCNSTNTGGAVLAGGILIQSAGSAVSLPLFANDVVIDNCAGPGVKLTGVTDIKFCEGWINSAAGTTCAVLITAGGQIKFKDSTIFGGSGGSAGTYEFLGSTATAGFTSQGNTCHTGPTYRFTGSGGCTDMFLDDHVPGATATSQVTNDEAKLIAGAARRWGKWAFQQAPTMASEDVHIVGSGGGEPAFQNGWAAYTLTIVFFWKDPTGVVHISGRVIGGSAAPVFTLPVGYRPFNDEFFAPSGGDGASSIWITSAGVVQLVDHTGSVVSLSGVTFRAAG